MNRAIHVWNDVCVGHVCDCAAFSLWNRISHADVLSRGLFSVMDGDSDDAESVESWEGDALGEEECLFCSHLSQSLESNVRHMTTAHGFFLPDVEYLVDLSGLIIYLGMYLITYFGMCFSSWVCIQYADLYPSI